MIRHASFSSDRYSEHNGVRELGRMFVAMRERTDEGGGNLVVNARTFFTTGVGCL